MPTPWPSSMPPAIGGHWQDWAIAHLHCGLAVCGRCIINERNQTLLVIPAPLGDRVIPAHTTQFWLPNDADIKEDIPLAPRTPAARPFQLSELAFLERSTKQMAELASQLSYAQTIAT